MAGRNLALFFESQRRLAKASGSAKPCIFLSHISVDKSAARGIANYLMVNGDVDVYLDENDAALQAAAILDNPKLITAFIEAGLKYSTHLMCLVTQDTVRSWWVPYEIGFAKNDGKEIATLKLKGEVKLPEFLEIGVVLKGTTSLNAYIKNMSTSVRKSVGPGLLYENLVAANSSVHPLDNYLDWQL